MTFLKRNYLIGWGGRILISVGKYAVININKMPNLRRNKMKWMLIILAFIAAKAQGQAIPL